VTDPRDGKLPPLTPEARKREAARAANRAGTGVSDSAQTRSLAERCISWGNVGPPMIPPTYYANFQIFQSRDVVIISHELMHDVRYGLPRWPRASPVRDRIYGWPLTRALGRRHAGRGHDEFHRPDKLPRASSNDAPGDQPHAIVCM
jgi:hypothetical protein